MTMTSRDSGCSSSPSKSHAASLPRLRPGDSPTATLPRPRKQTRIPPPQIPRWHFAAGGGTNKGAPSAAPQQSTRTTQNGFQPRQTTSVTDHSNGLSPSRSEDRYQTSPLPGRSSRPPQCTSSTPAQSPVLPPQTSSQGQDQIPPFDPPFFRLTHDEYRALRKKSHKPPAYKFSDFYLARQLRDLGRGWEGFIRAKKNAGREGRLESFQRQLQAELDETARLRGKALPVGAVSMNAAKDAASKIHLSSASHQRHKTRRPRRNQSPGVSRASVEVGNVENESTNHLQNAQTGRQDPNVSHAGHSPELGEGPSDEEPQRSHTDHPDDCSPYIPMDRPRPRRVDKMPDYRIRTIDEAEREAEREASPDSQPRQPSPSPREIYDALRPEFIQFICEWQGCRAVLNNLSRLKKHVGVVHGYEARKKLRCRWGTCGQFEDGDLATPVAFATIAELDDHVESRHMASLMWHMGDGRKGLGFVVDPSDDCPPYLLWNGIQVTPSVTGQEVETLAECRQRKGRLKEFLSTCNLAADPEMAPESEGSDEDEHMTSLW